MPTFSLAPYLKNCNKFLIDISVITLNLIKARVWK